MVYITILKKGKGTHTFRKDDSERFAFTYKPDNVSYFDKKGNYVANFIAPSLKGSMKNDTGVLFDFVEVKVV